jgi:hypothetical protein
VVLLVLNPSRRETAKNTTKQQVRGEAMAFLEHFFGNGFFENLFNSASARAEDPRPHQSQAGCEHLPGLFEQYVVGW